MRTPGRSRGSRPAPDKPAPEVTVPTEALWLTREDRLTEPERDATIVFAAGRAAGYHTSGDSAAVWLIGEELRSDGSRVPSAQLVKVGALPAPGDRRPPDPSDLSAT